MSPGVFGNSDQRVKARAEAGRSSRARIRRVDLREARLDRRDFDLIEKIFETQVEPILTQQKRLQMLKSRFAFFKGAVSVMAADLARLPHSGIMVQLCGDVHAQNLGSVATSSGELSFEFNDYDDTVRGPWEWDVKRGAASIAVVAQELGEDRPVSGGAVEAFLEKYFDSINQFSREPILSVAEHKVLRFKAKSPALDGSQRATAQDLLLKLTTGGRTAKFKDIRPLFWRVSETENRSILGCLDGYRESLSRESLSLFTLFEPVDVTFRIIGTGSVGVRDYVVLLIGNGDNDPLFLQIKQAVPSVYCKFLPHSKSDHEGRRIAEGQRAIQARSNLLLGWTRLGKDDFVVRQLSDHKASLDILSFKGQNLSLLAGVMGELLARGHARSGDAVAINGYCGNKLKVIRPLRDFSYIYAEQVKADFNKFVAAVKKAPIKGSLER